MDILQGDAFSCLSSLTLGGETTSLVQTCKEVLLQQSTQSVFTSLTHITLIIDLPNQTTAHSSVTPTSVFLQCSHDVRSDSKLSCAAIISTACFFDD